MKTVITAGLVTLLCAPMIPAYAQGAPAQAKPAANLAIVQALEDFRRTTVLYRLKYDFNDKKLTGADENQLALYPFANAWPALVSPVVREPDKYRIVGASGDGYSDTATDLGTSGIGFAFLSPLAKGLVPENTNTFLLLGGVAKDGGIVANNYASVYVKGDMAGLLNLQSYSTTVVRGDLSGTLYCGSYANVAVFGKMTGKVSFTSSCNAYLLGGFAGTLTLDRGAKVFIGGKTLEAALARITGTGTVYVESSDLKPGEYDRGETKIIVQGGAGDKTAAATLTPTVPRHLKPFYDGPDASDVADIPQQDLRAGGNPNMRYALIGPKPGDPAPKGGYKLLLILPGGDGSPDFNPFIRRIAKFAVPPGYVVAHLVAPVWNDRQANQIVWPTAKDAGAGAGFTTEAFIASVVKDVGTKVSLNSKSVWALGWSSGGPPVYASLLGDNSPLSGAFVAMSVFRPDNLPQLDRAKGKAVYLLHSPQDFIKISMAEAARDKLAEAGAKTTLTTYPGGHGWREDPFGHIERGITWLEASIGSK